MKSYKITDKLDYKKLGLACGLELHQQLDTHKLFCNCPSIIIKDDSKADKIITRKLQAVISESGKEDLTAKEEQNKHQVYKYYFYNKCNCLVETDSQPPFSINQEALEIAIMISKLTNSSLVDYSQIMRKQVLDGSNISGFQRTLMIATHGYLQFDFGKLRINKILLEEDSARVIERKKDEVVYSLDRLGIPLIELVAWHDIHDPEDVKKVAKKLGEIFRLTCRVKRGLGSIRQDINISITNGARVEIKGTQDLDLIPEIVKREVVRQLNIIEVKKELKKRKISSFNLEEINITKLLSNCKSKIVQSAIKDNKKVFAFKLENMKGILGFEIQPNRRVGTEIAGVLKKRTKLKGIFHLDELPNYGIEEKDINIIKNKLDLKEKDSFILLVCSNKEIIDAKHVIEKRLNNLINGVCVETRIITPEGNTIYQRPLSNSSRMYPETDHSKIYFTDQLIKKVNSTLPKNIKERKDLYLNKYKLNEQLVKKMVLSRYAVIFEKLVENTNINPTTIAIFLLENLLTLKRDYNLDLDNLDNSKIFDLFSYKHFNKLPKNKLNPIFIEYVNNNNNKTLEETIKDLKVFEDLNKIDTNKIIEDIFEENKEKIKKLKERSMGLLMGRFMAKSKGLVDGKNASKLISKKLKSFLKE